MSYLFAGGTALSWTQPKPYPQALIPTQQLNACIVHCSTRRVWLTLPSPKPLMTFPRVSRLLLIALPSVCRSLLSPSSLAASVLRSLPARSTKFRVETCIGEEALGAWMCPRADGHEQGQGCGEQTFTDGTLVCYQVSVLGCLADKGGRMDECMHE